jgi:hypothetical protein
MARDDAFAVQRSPKAGRPPQDRPVSPRLRRHQKSGSVAFRKGATLSQAAEGPRVVWGVKKPKTKKG